MSHLTFKSTFLYSILTLLSILGLTASQTTSRRLSNDPPVPYAATAAEACERQRYRAIDGYCNNQDYPYWAVPQRPYGKYIKCAYTNSTLPNSRLVSTVLFPDLPLLLDPVWNLNAGHWGQLIAHDMSFTTGTTQSYPNPIQCCTADGQPTQEAQTNPRCKPVKAPTDDPDLPQGYCINFVKSIKGADKGYTGADADSNANGALNGTPDEKYFTSATNAQGAVTHISRLTAVTGYMDLSIVYGNSDDESNSLRTGNDGLLKTVLRGNKVWAPNVKDSEVLQVCSNAATATEPCYLTGDLRSNQSPMLAMHQLYFVRYHNRVAKELKKINPHWDDETTFQETRRICIADYQHINYYEWLPIFLGTSKMQTAKLIYPGSKVYINDYDKTIDPSVMDEHATAAMRDFHSLIRGALYLQNELRLLTNALRLSDHLNRPQVLENGSSMDSLCRGSTTQSESARDQWWTSEITKFLFRKVNETFSFGGDLRMADIERSRNHNLCSYAAARAACNLKPVKSFADLTGLMSVVNIAALRTFYSKVEDIELVVAGSLETNVNGALVGETFQCIMIEQFGRTRKGDSYFYENGADPKTRFTLNQLNEIRKSKVATFLCDNADNVAKMQGQGFMKIALGNLLQSCSSYVRKNYSYWKDKNTSGKDPIYE